MIDWNKSVVREITMRGITLSLADGEPVFIALGNDLQNRMADAGMVGFGGQTDRIVLRDKPLPPAHVDDLGARMRARRQYQLNAGQ